MTMTLPNHQQRAERTELTARSGPSAATAERRTLRGMQCHEKAPTRLPKRERRDCPTERQREYVTASPPVTMVSKHQVRAEPHGETIRGSAMSLVRARLLDGN